MSVKIFDTFPRITLLLTGITGSGKTTQIGQLAKRLWEEKQLKTRLYSCDFGGADSIPDAPFIQVESLPANYDPFVWSQRVVQGYVLRDGKWTRDVTGIGLWAFDSATQLGQRMGQTVRESHAQYGSAKDEEGKKKPKGSKVGIGASAFVTTLGDGEETFNIASLDKSHFGIVQNRLEDLIKTSQNLPGHLVWTAGLRRLDADDDLKVPLAGPDLFGRALILQAPSWFKYTFPIMRNILPDGLPEHVLYIVSQPDQTVGGALVLANARIPMEGKDSAPVTPIVAPASVVVAFEMLAKRQQAAAAALKG
jgi:energy-coupling factor transporter ATP-binding protein EcfA2